ncbi:MAG TPA: 3-isopropylmalate dehydratase [Gemmatimonadaceae bacterium]|jgi:3-isopropylmalate/(R)-2-methylmalate dehydratase small subunit|nr:3-isopropylmalate dehydratase [Gemmatimonadaceae bacterium]
MRPLLDARARRFGDDVNTDYVISSTRKKETIDEEVLKRYLLETIDPAFAASVRPGDVIVAGRNFGCGSAMEVAATVILAAGIRAVVAQSFARTFYRNAVNNGLLPIECDTSDIVEGDHVVVASRGRGVMVRNMTKGTDHDGTVPSGIAARILAAGGLVPYLRLKQSFGVTSDRSRTS